MGKNMWSVSSSLNASNSLSRDSATTRGSASRQPPSTSQRMRMRKISAVAVSFKDFESIMEMSPTIFTIFIRTSAISDVCPTWTIASSSFCVRFIVLFPSLLEQSLEVTDLIQELADSNKVFSLVCTTIVPRLFQVEYRPAAPPRSSRLKLEVKLLIHRKVLIRRLSNSFKIFFPFLED